MREFESLVAALEGHFDKSWTELPHELRQRIERDLPLIAGTYTPPPRPDPSPVAVTGNVWDDLSVDQRRKAAHQRDAEHDPALEKEQQQSFELVARCHQLDVDIAKFESMVTYVPTEEIARQERLAKLQRERAEVDLALAGTNDSTPLNQHAAMTPRRAGRPADLRKEVREWLASNYPTGIPDNITTDALVAALKAARIVASPRTVDRARDRR